MRLSSLLRQATPAWVLEAAQSNRNFKGPNGHECVGYEWKWTWGEVYSKREDGLVPAKVSDHDNADTCSVCRAKIVHVYWVVDEQRKNPKPVGGDCLNKALGFPAQFSQSKLESVKKKVVEHEQVLRQQESRAKHYDLVVKTLAVPFGPEAIREANMKYAAWVSRSHLAYEPSLKWLVHPEKHLVMRGDLIAVEELVKAQPGWQESTAKAIRELMGHP